MGQNQTHLQSAPTTPRGRQPSQHHHKTPPPRPPSPPQIPKIPNYAVPENRVLPIDAGAMVHKRQLLRPVSQELTKFHPEFADIFQYNDNVTQDDADLKSRGSDEKENVSSSSRQIRESPQDSGPLSMSPVQNGGLSSPRYSHTLLNGDLSVKPNNIELSRSQSLQEKHSGGGLLNGSVPHGQVSINPNGQEEERGRSATRGSAGVHRTNSLDRSSSSPSKVRVHKRFPSATTNLANENSVIPEDPREHLYTHWRQDPFSNPTPQVVSLPVKNSFDGDYSLNLTYAQLAEFRRKQRVSELEDRTGKKLSELNAELAEKSTLPANPFDRNHYQPSQPSASSGTSSEIGVSKSKKRRAPPPPGGQRDSSPGRLSLDVEPPADYDLDDLSPRRDNLVPGKPSLSRKGSTASKTSSNSKGPAPKPPAPPPPPAPSASSTSLNAQTTQSLPRGATTKPPATSPSSGTLPAKGNGPISASSARLIAQAKAELEALKKLEILLKEKDSQGKVDEGQSAKDGADEDKSQGEDETNGASASEPTPPESESKQENGEEKTQEQEQQKSEGDDSSMSISIDSENQDVNPKPTEPEKTNSPRRLNSLLQHDIVLAAQARSMKGQVKPKSPVQRKKPKDAHELFREELAKAASAREERAKSADGLNGQTGESPPEDDSSETIVFKSDLVKVKRKPAINEVSVSSPTSEAVSVPADVVKVTEPSPPAETAPTAPMQAKVGVSKSESDLLSVQKTTNKIPPAAAARQRVPDEEINETSTGLRRAASENGVLDLSDDEGEGVTLHMNENAAARTFPEDWKPEDDLDSDDDMLDDLTYSRQSAALQASDGFKSSIIPGRVDDLKSAKRKSKSDRKASGSSTDERSKYGSIRKFRKSVHESVRNAFGSISKASGKLLKRGKSHDFGLDDVQGRRYRPTKDEDPRFSSSNGLDKDPRSSKRQSTKDPVMMNGHLSDDESDEDTYYDNEESLEPGAAEARSDKQTRKMKRAGVAYVGTKGQIVVLPEFETVQVDEDGNVLEDKENEGHAPRIYRKKKKKFTYESTVRRQEKDRLAERMAEEIREKERQIEFERRKQQEMERDIQRMRDMETQERLQRLQNAQLQQQMNLLQQQQQMTSQLMQGPGVHQRYSVPEFTTSNVYSTASGLGGVGGHLPPVNMSSYTMHSAPFVSPPPTTTTALAGYDINYLSNYMRMMGIQPPTTQQQWAFLLSSVSSLGGTASALAPLDPRAKGQGFVVSSAGPDLSSLFAPKTSTAYADTSALMAQKASLMSLLNSGPLPQMLPVDGDAVASGGMAVQGQTSAAMTLNQGHSVAGSGSARPKSMVAMTTGGADAPPVAMATVDSAKDRSNPLYYSSEEDDDEQTSKRSHSKNSRQNSKSKNRRRPVSVAIPVQGVSNVYRDVTSREEAGVMRVQVPDYRDDTAYIEDTVDNEGDDDSSDDNGNDMTTVNDLYDKVLREAGDVEDHNGGAGGDSPRDYGVSPRDSAIGELSPRSSKSLPANVYGPIGYKPVSFSPPSRRVEAK